MALELDLPAILAIGLAVSLTALLLKSTRRRGSLPPGPSGLPFLGMALEISSPRIWVKYTEWSKKYGDVMHFTAAGQSMVVLSSRKALSELLEQRGSIYSDRPRLVMAGDLAGNIKGVGLGPFGARHREHRKLMNEALMPTKVVNYYGLEEDMTHTFLVDLLNKPEDFILHTRRAVAGIVFMLTHGYELAEGEDALLDNAERVNDDFSESAAPGAFMVDLFSFLRYLPRWLGLAWMKKEKMYIDNISSFLDGPYEAVRRQMAEGTAKPSFVSRLIEREEKPSFEREELFKWVTGAFFGGGADTTVSAITSFFLAMTLYPEVQRKAQAEIQRVVGSSRLPNFSDRASLPYVQALVAEVHRWNPVAPNAIPHRLMKDDIYNGYLIPEGTIVIPNSWAVLHDNEVYPSPFEFNPERYFDEAAIKNGLNPDPRKFIFGYGRRVCPGQYLAENTLFIAVAAVLATFNLEPVDNKDPSPDYSLSQGYSWGTISHPEAFKCRIVPLSEEARALVKANDPKNLSG